MIALQPTRREIKCAKAPTRNSSNRVNHYLDDLELKLGIDPSSELANDWFNHVNAITFCLKLRKDSTTNPMSSEDSSLALIAQCLREIPTYTGYIKRMLSENPSSHALEEYINPHNRGKIAALDNLVIIMRRCCGEDGRTIDFVTLLSCMREAYSLCGKPTVPESLLSESLQN
jgi:hypothetical protein